VPVAKVVEEIGVSLSVVLAWFAVLAVIGALIWDKVVTLPEFTRVATTGSMDEEQLSHQFSISGWFLVIAVVGGLLSGVVLMVIRRKNPIATVVLVALGSGLATWLMLTCGLAFGPDNPNTVLTSAKLGEKVPVQLKPDVNAVYYAWSVAALFGCVLALWILETVSTSRQRKRPQTTDSFYG
jgi:MFS family permease